MRVFVRQQVARRHLVLPVGEIADVGAVFRTAVMLEPDPAEIVGDREQEMVIVVMLRSEGLDRLRRSEEHTSELQSLMRISYAVFCLKKKKQSHTTASDNNMTQ